jgi:ATP-binding cassette, subfamily C (CFTR/MRP), member 1
LAALFRAADVQQGSILIDGVDIRGIPLHILRSSLTLLPQEPVLVSGSLRHNLDPLGDFDDLQLWDALEKVSMKATIESLEGGLSASVAEGGSNFSTGQRQLLTAARALLRRTRVVVVDEASSATDVTTDAALQSAIRKCFHDSTVLTIAHRVHTIIDSDRVLVLDAGRIVELDTPEALLAKTDSVFASLVRHSAASAGGSGL